MKGTVGTRIRKIRKDNKDTLKELADKLGYDYSNLSKIERGVYGASLEVIKSISDIYGVDPTYFLSDDITIAEGNLLYETNLEPSALKEKYDFTVDGVEATEEEIKEAVRLIRMLKNKSL